MTFLLELKDIGKADRRVVGGKAFALSRMVQAGMRVPRAVCITTRAYDAYMAATRLSDHVAFELFRKSLDEMRWEEVWDTALRIRSLFLKAPIPADLRDILLPYLSNRFGETEVSVRSSAPGEDSARKSFAGLHDSFLNVRGASAILEHVHLVWASLWSDRSILYRKELELDARKSRMAVVIQEMVFGERAGVAFGRNPMDPKEAIVEAVYGLNQGLVDGTVEPDRWVIKRDTEEIVSHVAVLRKESVKPLKEGVSLVPLASELREQPPLSTDEVLEVYALTKQAESLFRTSQDVEWTYRGNVLFALQSRPITTLRNKTGDIRHWYLSLHRSLENLKALRGKIETELLPDMDRNAVEMAAKDLTMLSELELAKEIEHRKDIFDHWQQIYREFCIPFAHGMRLFGQVYNDRVKPEDPYEFMALLKGADMVSVHRNNALRNLADWIERYPDIASKLREGRLDDCDEHFVRAFRQMMLRFGGLTWGGQQFGANQAQVIALLLEMVGGHRKTVFSEAEKRAELEHVYLSKFSKAEKTFARELLDVARASYQLRDDDNTYIGKIEGELLAAVREGARRKKMQFGDKMVMEDTGRVTAALKGVAMPPSNKTNVGMLEEGDFLLRPRQLIGQPAGPGVASGIARVIRNPSDLFNFKSGEILVCDAVDPNMTFVIPMAAGVVERRGGMLIHGAIIAREYGLPCVTGVRNAASQINTGDAITVDGFLGIVVVGER